MKIQVQGKSAYAYTAGHAVDLALPTIVFIHGGEQDHSAWALQSRYFAYHGYNALVPDLPGHGRSAGPALGSITELAGWIARFLDAAGIKNANIAGHSMGSLVALEFTARQPSRVIKLALLSTAAPMPVAAPLLEAARAHDHAALEMINVWSHGSRAHIGGNTVPGMWMTGMNLRLMERQSRDVLYVDFKACNDYTGGTAAATTVKCPVMVIAGSRDQMTPPRANQDLLKALPQARSVLFDGAGHALMAEKPDAVLDALIGFF